MTKLETYTTLNVCCSESEFGCDNVKVLICKNFCRHVVKKNSHRERVQVPLNVPQIEACLSFFISKCLQRQHVYVVVNYLSLVIFIFPLIQLSSLAYITIPKNIEKNKNYLG